MNTIEKNKNILLTNIQKNLYEIETILNTELIQNLLKKHDIDAGSFLDTINLYQQNFELLRTFKNTTLLEMLNEKLDYFYNNSQDRTYISSYYTKLAISITFIKDKVDTFFKHEKKSNKESIVKQDINIPIDNIKISDFFSIKDIELTNLKDKKEIYIVGENGDGKTLLLQAIAIGLKGVLEGDVFDLVKNQTNRDISINLQDQMFFSDTFEYKNLFAYGSHRNNSCKIEIDKTGYLTLFSNKLDLNDPVEWLKKLYNAKNAHEDTTPTLKEAKTIIQKLLSRDVQIEVTFNNVEFKEKNSTVTFEQLSAGYRSVIIIICDLLDRLAVNQPNVSDIKEYQAVVLIDEVELHLHPKWKYNFIKTLRDFFPKIQFIVTTHSPTVILGASKEAVFYKIYKEDGEVQISSQMPNEGYTNNTLISSPLFDLKTMKSKHFSNDQLSDDDYIYSKIHKAVELKLKKDFDIDENNLLEFIAQELDTQLDQL